jgi:hypothetical protein
VPAVYGRAQAPRACGHIERVRQRLTPVPRPCMTVGMRTSVRGLALALAAFLVMAAAPATADARIRFKLKLPKAGDISVAQLDLALRGRAARRLPRPRLQRALPRGFAAVARVRRTARGRASVEVVTARRGGSSSAHAAAPGDGIVFTLEPVLLPGGREAFVLRAGRQVNNVTDKNNFPPALGIAFNPPFAPWRFLPGGQRIRGLGAKALGDTGLALAADFPSLAYQSPLRRLGSQYCYGAWTGFTNGAGLTLQCDRDTPGFAINTPRHDITNFFPNSLPCTIGPDGNRISCLPKPVQAGANQQIFLQFSQPLGFRPDFGFVGSQGPGTRFTYFPTVPPIPPSQDPCNGVFAPVPGAPGAVHYRFDCNNPVRQFTLTFGDRRTVRIGGFIPPPGFDCAPPPRPFFTLRCTGRGQEQKIVSGRLYGTRYSVVDVIKIVAGDDPLFNLERR